MFNRIARSYRNIIEHYSHEKYWRRRFVVVNTPPNKKKILKLFYLRYLKKCDSFNCSYICTHIGGGAIFENTPFLPHGLNGIIIGDNVLVGKNVTILHRVTISEGTKDNPTIIGNNVFIGAGAVVRSGLVVGDNVKIGANAVVTRNIPSNCIVGGVPARVIKNRKDNLE